MESLCRRFFSSLNRYIRNAMTFAFDHTAGFWYRLQRQGCTKQLIKVEAAGRFSGVRRLPGTGPSALETHAFPTPAIQNQQLTLRNAGSGGPGAAGPLPGKVGPGLPMTTSTTRP
jgi:hypothetical protein